MPSFRALIAISLCATLAGAAVRPKDPKKPADPSSNSTVRKWMRGMSLHDKVAQLVMMPIYGEVTNTRSAAFRKYQHFVRDLHVGGKRRFRAFVDQRDVHQNTPGIKCQPTRWQYC